MISNLYFFR